MVMPEVAIVVEGNHTEGAERVDSFLELKLETAI